MPGVARVARLPRRVEGELGGDRLPQDHGAGGAESRDAGGVGRRPPAPVERRAAGGGHVGGVDDVLHAHRQSPERRGPRQGVDAARLGERQLGIEELPG